MVSDTEATVRWVFWKRTGLSYRRWIEFLCTVGVFFFAMTGADCRSYAQEEHADTPPEMPAASGETFEAPVSQQELRSTLVVAGMPEATVFSTVFRMSPPPYKPGEELTYSFKHKGITAGRAVLKVLDMPEPFNGHNVVKLDAVVETNTFASLFYRLSNHSYSLVDADMGFSRLYCIDLKEKRMQYQDTVEYDYDKGVGRYNRNEDGKDLGMDFPLYGPVTDVASVVYYYRHFPQLAVGDVVEVPLSTAKDVYLLRMKIGDKGLIKVRGLGTVKALKTVPFEGIANGPAITKAGSSLWIEEATHIPLRVTLELPSGLMTMYLVSVTNVIGLKALDAKQVKTAKKEGYQ
jgi:hypothetical protein